MMTLPESLRTIPAGVRPWSIAGICRRFLIYRRIVIPVAVLGIAVCYVLSYVPVMALGLPRPRDSMLDLYDPVEWLIDNTSLSDPLLAWSERWGLHDKLANASANRIREGRFAKGPWVQFLILAAVVSVAVMVPAWIMLVVAKRLQSRVTALMQRMAASPRWTLRMACTCAAVVTLAGGIGYAIWYWAIPARHVASIPDTGAPFDVDRFGVIDVPDGRNAFVLYTQANELLTPVPEVPIEDLAIATRGMEPMPAEFSPKLSDWLASNQKALELWREATERPDALYLQPRDMHVQTLLPVVAGVRLFTCLAIMQAHVDRVAGKMDSAWAWYRAALRCSRHCGKHGCLIERAIGCDIYEQVSRHAAKWGADERTSAALLEQAMHDVEAINASTAPFSQNLRTDFFALRNTIAGMGKRSAWPAVAGGAATETYFSAAELAEIQATLDLRYRRFEPEWSLRIINAIYANWLAHYDLPRSERPARSLEGPRLFLSKSDKDGSAKSMSTEQIEIAFDKTILCKLLLPAVEMVDRAVFRDEMRRGFLVLSLALQLHHRRQGGFPETLEELVGDGLLKLPTDPWGTGEPLHYRRSGDDAVVWSGPMESARTGSSIDQAIDVRAPGKRKGED